MHHVPCCVLTRTTLLNQKGKTSDAHTVTYVTHLTIDRQVTDRTYQSSTLSLGKTTESRVRLEDA